MPLDVTDRLAVAAFVRARGLGVVATVDAAGRPEAALVGLAALEDGALVLDAHHASRKIANLRGDPHVAVVVGLDGEVTLQLEGLATIVDGDERLAHATAYDQQLPGSRVFDEDLAVVVIRPTWLRSYDASGEVPVIAETHLGDPGPEEPTWSLGDSNP